MIHGLGCPFVLFKRQYLRTCGEIYGDIIYSPYLKIILLDRNVFFLIE